MLYFNLTFVTFSLSSQLYVSSRFHELIFFSCLKTIVKKWKDAWWYVSPIWLEPLPLEVVSLKPLCFNIDFNLVPFSSLFGCDTETLLSVYFTSKPCVIERKQNIHTLLLLPFVPFCLKKLKNKFISLSHTETQILPWLQTSTHFEQTTDIHS